MIDELFHIGSFSISPFGVMLVVAFFGAYLQLRSGLRSLGVGDEEDASALLFWPGLAGIVGGKLYYALLYGDPLLVFDRAGIVWYGGFLAGAAAFVWTVRRRRLPAWPTVDAAGPALALGYGLGRIGCFLVGDDYGRPTDAAWGVVFRKGLPPTTADSLERSFDLRVPPELVGPDGWVSVHPTQLYETFLALAIWGLGVWLLRRRPEPAGTVCLVTVGLLSVERFGIEFLRAKDDRFLGGFTLAQAISVAVLLATLALLAKRRAAAVAGG